MPLYKCFATSLIVIGDVGFSFLPLETLLDLRQEIFVFALVCLAIGCIELLEAELCLDDHWLLVPVFKDFVTVAGTCRVFLFTIIKACHRCYLKIK